MNESRATSYRTMMAGSLRAEDAGERVRLSGWIHRRRDLGGLIFIDLRDRAGRAQLSFGPDWSAPEVLLDETSGTVASEVWALAATVYSLLAGRSPHLEYRPEQIDVSFDDVIGIGPVKEEVLRTLNTFLGYARPHTVAGTRNHVVVIAATSRSSAFVTELARLRNQAAPQVPTPVQAAAVARRHGLAG